MNENDIIKQVSSSAVPQQPAINGIGAEIPSNASVPVSALTQAAPAVSITDGTDAVIQTAMRDMTIIGNFMKAGIINPVQGQHLMNYVLNKAREVIAKQNETGVASSIQASAVTGIDDFITENPDFFQKNGRTQVLDYLKNSKSVVDKDEILRISQMVEALEQSAIEGYLQKQAHEKSLNDENEAAKQKLRANAQNSNAADANVRVFTREQIGKMSGAEFAKNERAIMDQLRKGLIR